MILYKEPSFSIYFGDKEDTLMPAWYLNLQKEPPLLEQAPFSQLKQLLHLNDLMFLHQTHSTQGFILDEKQRVFMQPFKQDGDYLITKQLQRGLGIMTADCLPIVYYDPINNVVAIAHAGWKGAVAGIAVKTAEHMNEAFGTQFSHLKIFFGPSAKVCCYTVSDSFEKHLDGFKHKNELLVQKEGNWYFDLPGLNRLELEALGVPAPAINLQYNFCTICDDRYYSYRRQGEEAGRNMTVISLQ